jgi:hypothetical protein
MRQVRASHGTRLACDPCLALGRASRRQQEVNVRLGLAPGLGLGLAWSTCSLGLVHP